MPITGSCVHLKSQPRLPGELTKGISGPCSRRPGANVLAANRASLAHRLQIPIDLVELARKSRVEHVALLVAAGVKVSDVVLLVERVVRGQFVGAEHLP